jgi:hypothetical protein
MTNAIDTVFIDAILKCLLRTLGLPETLPLNKLSPRMQEWIFHEAEGLRRDAMTHATVAVLVKRGLPLTRENYLALNGVEEEDMDGELEAGLPHVFQGSMVEARVDDILFEMEIDDTLRRLEHLPADDRGVR